MIYRVFEDTYSDSKVIGEFGTLLLAKMFITMKHPNVEYAPPFYDQYYQLWDLLEEPEYLMTTVSCEGIEYSIYPLEDTLCLECGID